MYLRKNSTKNLSLGKVGKGEKHRKRKKEWETVSDKKLFHDGKEGREERRGK